MPTELALELCHLIIQNVARKADLRSLALCCSAFCNEAQQCLFGYVKLNDLRRQRQFLSAINGAPLRLGPLVHSFYIIVHVEALHTYDHLASLSNALHAMPGLKHLRLSQCQTSSAILRGCTFQLLTLVCDDLLENTEVLFFLRDFLPTQTRIKHLQIYVWEPTDVSEVPIDLCPNLDSLGTNDNNIVSALLPDPRIISQLRCRNSVTPSALTVHQLNQLKSLTFGIDAFVSDVSFTSHLTSLVNLEVRISLSNVAPFVHDLPFLQNIPCLKSLRLNFVNLRLEPPDAEYHLELFAPFQKIFEVCPLLEHVDIIENYMGATFMGFVRQKTAQQDIFVWTKRPVYSTNIGMWRYLTV